MFQTQGVYGYPKLGPPGRASFWCLGVDACWNFELWPRLTRRIKATDWITVKIWNISASQFSFLNDHWFKFIAPETLHYCFYITVRVNTGDGMKRNSCSILTVRRAGFRASLSDSYACQAGLGFEKFFGGPGWAQILGPCTPWVPALTFLSNSR